MRKALIVSILGLGCLLPGVFAQKKGAKAPAAAPALQDLIAQGKLPDAVRIAQKNPTFVAPALKSLIDAADLQITERRIPDARSGMEKAKSFVEALSKGKTPAGPLEPISGRLARIAGIELIDTRQYVKAEAKLREALELSRKAGDKVLEAGVHNNLGVALRARSDSDEKSEEAAKEFDTARKMAEEQKDSLRAGSYNFNLGQALLQLGRPSAALDAFKRSAEQNQAAGKANLQARAIMFQAVSLSRIDAVGSEPIKLFDTAHRMFLTAGDDQNAGWALVLMADHLAYGSKFRESASAAERALPFLTKAKDNGGLLRCYTLLGDMYGRLEDQKKAELYKQKAAGLSPAR